MRLVTNPCPAIHPVTMKACILDEGHEGVHCMHVHLDVTLDEAGNIIRIDDLDDDSGVERCPGCGLTACSGGCRG